MKDLLPLKHLKHGVLIACSFKSKMSCGKGKAQQFCRMYSWEAYWSTLNYQWSTAKVYPGNSQRKSRYSFKHGFTPLFWKSAFIGAYNSNDIYTIFSLYPVHFFYHGVFKVLKECALETSRNLAVKTKSIFPGTIERTCIQFGRGYSPAQYIIRIAPKCCERYRIRLMFWKVGLIMCMECFQKPDC